MTKSYLGKLLHAFIIVSGDFFPLINLVKCLLKKVAHQSETSPFVEKVEFLLA